ncbi:MAG: hypothetical protein EOP31_23980 [Rhodococcus sp. (in: high G+C Gram-positive bacteria)]|uniref:hypothetical protein n=1 Tax=Rhodococcus sp. TaxID=1831 RepID=UPI001209779D|nr:hypothetical protein [Rhodococcus sp. (in: high G+C Gram-positive bacteria)]RZL22559.1 MAG: hypothetical protein EOP31_23980 [Rhodococcus sp. (in: high G+C Gram-positive bacteria)]
MPIRNAATSTASADAAESIIAQRNSLSVPDEILDSGSVGLDFFERFHDAATRLGIEMRPLGSYDEMYRAESGIDLQALHADVLTMSLAAEASSRDSQDFAVLSESLAEIWNVEAVDDVAGRVRDEQRRAEVDVEAMPLLISVADGLAGIVRTSVVDKAFKVASLNRETIGGIDAQRIDQLVDVSTQQGGVDAVAKAATWFAPLSDEQFRAVRYAAPVDQIETCRAAADLVRPWIDQIFRPVYVDTRDEFDRACEQARVALTDAFGVAAGIVSELFPVESESTETRHSSVPADAAQTSVPQAVEPSGARVAPALELAVGANTWGFSLAPDGRGVSLEVRDLSGESVTVTVELDEHGWPRIAVETDAAPVMSEAPEPAPQPYQPPNPTPVDTAPSEDPAPPEHRESLNEPIVTGAELAGAGPI